MTLDSSLTGSFPVDVVPARIRPLAGRHCASRGI